MVGNISNFRHPTIYNRRNSTPTRVKTDVVNLLGWSIGWECFNRRTLIKNMESFCHIAMLNCKFYLLLR